MDIHLLFIYSFLRIYVLKLYYFFMSFVHLLMNGIILTFKKMLNINLTKKF